MKSINLYGKKRESMGSASAKALRSEGFVPCVLYGTHNETIHFYAFVTDFKNIIYTPEVHIVHLHLEGEQYKAVVRESQYHPLSDQLIHVDFFRVEDDKVITTDLPVILTGMSRGVRNGGKLVKKVRKLSVKGVVSDLPAAIEIDVTPLRINQSVKVKDIKTAFEILSSPHIPIATIISPRALQAMEEEEETAEATEESTASSEEGESTEVEETPAEA
ncbi:MAG: 50S ribosomal protein L25 [Bacteroidia bacterium]